MAKTKSKSKVVKGAAKAATATPRRQSPAVRSPNKEGTTSRTSKGPSSKQDTVVALLRQPKGAPVDTIVKATGWQPHSVRGAISGTLKKKLGLVIAFEKSSRGRIYRIR